MTAEQRQAEWDRLTAWVESAREVYRDSPQAENREQPAAVVVQMPELGRDRWTSVWFVAGELTEVMRHVGWLLETATCTQQYEHMLPRVMKVEEVNGLALVKIVKNNYAGD